MARYVIDPVVLLALAESETVPNQEHQLVAPNSIRTHALELLLYKVRAAELSESRALAINELATGIKIRLLGDRVSRSTAWKIALTHGWDDLRLSEYLAVTKLQADALVALDPHLVAAAASIVTLAPLSVLLPAHER